MIRWLFADQLGPHFLDDPDQRILLIESRAAFRRRRYHRAKAQLVLSALRHRAAELGDRAIFIQADTYTEALSQVRGPIEVIHPTSRAALEFVSSRGMTVLPPRGFITTFDEFNAHPAKRLEDFYRAARRRTGLLMDGDQPEGGRWNYDADNRLPPPKGADRFEVPDPWFPVEDEIDEQVRADLAEIPTVGRDGPRLFAGTATEAQAAADQFFTHRLPAFGPYEDAVLKTDPWLAHSMLSAPLNLGLLDPWDLVQRAATADAPLASREGFIRQILGWRDYIWHLYWQFGPEYRQSNALAATKDLPQWFADLDSSGTEAACLSQTLADVATRGWVHHIPRLMILGSWALQQGYDPEQVTDWFQANFVDGYEWVMLPNVIGMSQFADGGRLATKPYTSGGAYLNRMTNYCGGCRFSPTKRVGEQACPFTTNYWAFLARNEQTLAGNHRMKQPLASMRRLEDLPAVIAQADQGS